jgi:DNA-binding SARP family transcriptional activator
MVIQVATVDVGRTTHIPVPTREPKDSASARVRVNLLGGFEVSVENDVIAARHWSRRHSSALVKLLAMTPGRSLHREVVIDALWPDLAVDDAAPRLHKAAHYARKAHGHRDAVVLLADAVSLWPDGDVHVDMVQFRQLAGAAISSGSVAAAKRALAVYGGELLPQDVYETWADQPRQHVRRLHIELLRLVEDWHQLLAADPADESAHLGLARRYADRGDRIAALRQLDHLDRVMRHELGLQPSESARQLRARVFWSPHHDSIEGLDAVGRDAPCPLDRTERRQQCCDQLVASGR